MVKKALSLEYNKNLEITSPNTYLASAPLLDFVNELKKNSAKDIWLIGSGELVSYVLEQDLLDEMILTIVPLILGEGIPLFVSPQESPLWQLSNVEQFSTGLVSLTYTKK